MSAKNEVAQRDSSTEVTALSPEEEALVQANQSEVDTEDFIVPILKLAQPLTNEVSDGLASPGDFILSLTGEAFTAPLEFIVAGKSKGRFKPGKKGERTLVANDTTTVPWKDDPFYGQPFSEHPDAEEAFKAAVNDGKREWGSGPPIQTTANYTGLVVGSDVPVRFSIRLTNKHARNVQKKWNTLLDAVLRGRYWDQVFELGSAQESNASGDRYFVPTVKLLRKTTPEERQRAVELATVLRSQNIREVGGDDAPVGERPAANGGLEV